MSGIHIDEFYADAVRTLVGLYSVFPRPITVFAEDICGPDEPDEYGLHSHRYQACFSTLLWLGEEGYLRYADTIRQDAIDQAVLSGRCFAALVSAVPGGPVATERELPPSIQAEHASIVFHMEQALKHKSSTEIRDAFLPLMKRMTN